MKKYERPVIETVEANLYADYMIGTSSGDGYAEEQLSPGRKNKDYKDEDDFSEGW